MRRNSPGVRATGEVTVAEIGFDADLLTSEELTINLTTPREAAALLPDRRAGGHKGTFGNALIFGGSPGMTGAAVLAARAAARSGVGKVYVAYPEALGAIFETLLIEPVKHGDERGVLLQGDEVVEQGRRDVAHRLREDDEAIGLPGRQPQ